MSIGIGISNGSYYTEVSNNFRSNNDKTIVNNTSTTTKITSKEEYFKNLCNKYSNVNLYMSDSHFNKENELTYNISPKLINKAIRNPKTAENLNRLLDQIPSLKEYISTHKYSLCGSEVKSVSVVIDENGGCSCKVELKQENSRNTSKISDEEKLRLKRMKEQKERESKLTREQKIYSNIAKNIAIDFFDTNV